jgi:hypothetical protein
MMKMQRNAGAAPITNSHFHDCAGFMSESAIAHRPAVTLPTADSACNSPSAFGRASSGNESATSATASPNTPPTPSPVTAR